MQFFLFNQSLVGSDRQIINHNFNLDNMLTFSLLQGTRTCFGVLMRSRQPFKVDTVFKEYFSGRLMMVPAQYESYLKDVCRHNFNEEDHRWQSLTKNIEQHIHVYNVGSQVSMLKALVDIKSRTQLLETLTTQISNKINALTLDEIAVFLWCVSKLSEKNRFNMLLAIFKIITELVMPSKEGYLPPIVIRNTKKEEEREVQTDQINIRPSSLSMIIISMGKLSIVDKPLLKRLIQDGVRPNLKEFNIQTLVTFLVAFQKLQMRNMRDTFHVYKQIRERAKQLEQADTESLFNLLICVSNLARRKPSQNDIQKLQKYPDEREKKNKEEEDMKHFFLWVAETFILKQPNLSLAQASNLILNSSKIETFNYDIWKKCLQTIEKSVNDSKVIDLVMCLSAIASLSKDMRILLEKEEEVISNRLWQLSSSIDGRSMSILAGMLKKKKIRLPKEMVKKINQFLMQEERRNMQSSQKSKQQNPLSPQKEEQVSKQR